MVWLMMVQRTKPVVVEGFMLSAFCPTEDNLNVSIDASSIAWQRYHDLKENLQDQLTEVDENYKRRDRRGRTLKTRDRRLITGTVKKDKRLLRFPPYPSRFINSLKSIRRKLYVEIGRQCLVLQSIGGTRNFYLLPFSCAPAITEFRAELNKEIAELNQEVAEYRQTAFFQETRETLEAANVNGALDAPVVIPDVQLDMTILRLDPDVVNDLLENKYKQMQRAGVEAIRRELENKRKDMVERTLETFRQDIQKSVQAIVKGKRLTNVKKELKRLRLMAADVGLAALATSVIDPLIEVAEDPSKAPRIFGNIADIAETVDGRLSGLVSGMLE